MKKRQGFTLIELVIVIAILGILAGIAISRFLDAQASARGAKVLANLRTIDSAAALYMTRNGKVPSLEDLTGSGADNAKYLDIESSYEQGDFKIKTNSGEEVTYTDSGSYGVNTEGRGYLMENSHTVDYYLGLGTDSAAVTALKDKLDNLRKYAQNTTPDLKYPNPYAAAQDTYLKNGTVYALTKDELAALGLNYDGTLYLRSATAVMMDKSFGDIQMLGYYPNGTYEGGYASAAFIVDGKMYVMQDASGNVAGPTKSFGNGLATVIDGEKKDEQGEHVTENLTYAAQAIQYLYRGDAGGNGWTDTQSQYAWFENALVTAGYSYVGEFK